MTECLAIQPFTQPLKDSEVTPPGSKSITNRALILAALSNREITLTQALFSRDTRIMADSLMKLGFSVSVNEDSKSITIKGESGNIPSSTAKIHVGNAGTAARFLTGFLSLHPSGEYEVDGDEAMYKRPMKGLIEALEKHGAASFEFLGEPYAIPFKMKTKGLPGGCISIDAGASSQILSAILMIAAFAESELKVELAGETVSHPFIKMTVDMVNQFGFEKPEEPKPGTYTFKGKAAEKTTPSWENHYSIEPDATAASYHIAMPIVTGGLLQITHTMDSLQGDAKFSEAIAQTGLNISRNGNSLISSHTRGETLNGVNIDFNPISDTFLTLAALSPLLKGPTIIRGIAHTRHQETDRVAAMATELIKLGQKVIEKEDSLEIHPAPLKEAVIETYEDHRIAMSFGILGCHDLHGNGKPWLSINDPACCSKTFPDFFDILNKLHQQSHS